MQALSEAFRYHLINQRKLPGQAMLRFKIKEMIAKKEFKDGRRITIGEVAEAAGIHRMTLSKMINQKGYNTGSENIDRLCTYFQCSVGDIIEHVPEA